MWNVSCGGLTLVLVSLRHVFQIRSDSRFRRGAGDSLVSLEAGRVSVFVPGS